MRLDVDAAYIGSLPPPPPTVDARAVTDLTASVNRGQRALDYAMSTLASRSPDALTPPLRAVLRLALHELASGAPAHALASHVALAKKLGGGQGAASLANGVLRAASAAVEEHGSLPLPPAPAAGATDRAALRALAIRHSHPDWLARRWVAAHGWEGAAALMDANNARPRYALRSVRGEATALAAELADAGASVAPSRLLPSEFVVVERGLSAARGALARGDAALQDEAAAAVIALAAPAPGDALLDVCAAPGGKALFAAARMGGVGRIVARDVSGPRVARVADAAAAQGVTSPFFTTDVGDGLALPSDVTCLAAFDIVLLDAPCSGTGVLSKRADLRWRRTPDDVAAAADLQGRLLAAAATAVKPGGVLVYSTCSLEPEENAGAVAAFLESEAGRGFRVEPPPEGALPADVLTEDGLFLQTLPHVHGTDGAFGARLRRVE